MISYASTLQCMLTIDFLTIYADVLVKTEILEMIFSCLSKNKMGFFLTIIRLFPIKENNGKGNIRNNRSE